MKILVVVDMQNDFITGSLGTPEAQAIVPKVKSKVERFLEDNPDGKLLFTRDTHFGDYLTTQEGEKLPIEHCIKNSWGWEICDELKAFAEDYGSYYDKYTFGSIDLADDINYFVFTENLSVEVELVGLCTGICILANTVTIKSLCPEAPITVDASCCACVTPESHKTAIEAMKLLQINIIGE